MGVEVIFGSEDGLIIGPAFGAENVAAKAIYSMLIVLAVEGLAVERDDGDLSPTARAVAVGREGEDGNLIFSLGQRGRIRLDLIQVRLVQLRDA